jgi:hypothetical protein
MTAKKPAPMQRKSPDSSKSVTSDDIAAHLAAFEAAGGHVEVLGVTRVLKRVDEALPQPTPSASR